MRFVYRLRERGRTFSTRPRGAEMREALLRDAAGAGVVVLDFADVLSISYSFADEFVGSLRALENRGDLPFGITVANASDEVARVVDRAVANRTASEPFATQCFA